MMAKVSDEVRLQYVERIKPYQAEIDAIIKREKILLQKIKTNSHKAAVKRLSLAGEMISLTASYIILSGVSQSMIKQRNEEALNDARKALYKAIIYLEEVVSPYVDAPFSEYEERLAEIESVEAGKRYLLVRKLGLVLQLLKNAYGDNTKWKWAFVEIEGRFAAVVKNILNLKTAVANTDPRSPDYEPTVYHITLMKKLLAQAADRYRERYELSTNLLDDFKKGIDFLNSLKRIHVVLGERSDAESAKKKSANWTAKFEKDIKKEKDTKDKDKEETAQKRL